MKKLHFLSYVAVNNTCFGESTHGVAGLGGGPSFWEGDQRVGALYGGVTLLSKLDLLQVGGGLHQGFALSPILFTVFMDRILGGSLGEGLQLGDLKIS